MNTLKRCRFIRAWQNYRVGDVIQPTGVLRDFLRENGFVEIVDEAPPAEQRVETASMTNGVRDRPMMRKHMRTRAV